MVQERSIGATTVPTGTGAALSLPVRWRFSLLSRSAPVRHLL